MNAKRTVLAVLLVVPLTLAAVPTAPAKDGDVRRAGRCNGPSTAKIKLSEENGRIESTSRSIRTGSECAGASSCAGTGS
jgi:hypothetical protein